MGHWELKIEDVVDDDGQATVDIKADFVGTEEDKRLHSITPGGFFPMSLCIGSVILQQLGVLANPKTTLNGAEVGENWLVNQPSAVKPDDKH